jgi:hypothetical protein
MNNVCRCCTKLDGQYRQANVTKSYR